MLPLLIVTAAASVLTDDPPAPKFYVVDFAPVDNLEATGLTHDVTFLADRGEQQKPLNWNI